MLHRLGLELCDLRRFDLDRATLAVNFDLPAVAGLREFGQFLFQEPYEIANIELFLHGRHKKKRRCQMNQQRPTKGLLAMSVAAEQMFVKGRRHSYDGIICS